MSDREFGKCDYCGKEDYIEREYYHYNIECECHSPNHFEIRKHCKNCFPIAPEKTTLTIRTCILTHHLIST